MSGLETAAAVYGVVSGTITIIQVSIQIYDVVKDKSGIPPKLRAVSEKLPSLVEILQGAEAQYNVGQPDESTWVSAAADVKKCEEACQELQDLLRSAYPEKDAGRVRCFLKSTGTVVSGKHRTAEQLLANIWEYLKLLLDRSILTNTALLEDIKKTVDELLPASGPAQYNVYGTNMRDQIYNNTQIGTGQQFNGPGGTFNFHSGVIDDLNEANKIKKAQKEEDRVEKLQAWLRFDTIDYRKAEILDPHERTFQWAFPSTNLPAPESVAGDEFTSWLREGDGIFWIQGILGSGKSTLMKYINEHPLLRMHLNAWARGHSVHIASFYSTKLGSSVLQRSLQGLYRTLLADLIEGDKHLALLAFPNWQESDSEVRDPPVGIFRDAMKRILASQIASRRFCFLIDGLDEYEDIDPMSRTQLAKDILNLAKLPTIKIVVASRPEPSFGSCFGSCPTIELHLLTQNDITAYVQAEFTRNPTTQLLTHLEVAQLAQDIVTKAGGVFLWVILVVANILNGVSYGETYDSLQAQILTLHNDLYVLLVQILNTRILPQHRRETARCLMLANRHRHRQRMFRAPSYSFRNLWLENWTINREMCPLTVYVIGQKVDKSYTQDRLASILQSPTGIERQTELLRSTLPRRSCGLFAWAPFGMKLLHSSINEFVEQAEIATTLQNEAGEGFDVDLALAAGRIANLLSTIDGMIQGSIEATKYVKEDKQWRASLLMAQSLEILHCIEELKDSGTSAQTNLLHYFDRLCHRDWELPGIQRLVDLAVDSKFTKRMIIDGSLLPRRGQLVSFAINYGFTCYIRHLLQNDHDLLPDETLLNGAVDAGRFYQERNFDALGSQEAYRQNTRSTPWHPDLLDVGRSPEGIAQFKVAELLLERGADPNRLVYCLSAWERTLYLIYTCIGPKSMSFVPLQKREPILQSLCSLARCMLNHGADPMCVWQPIPISGIEPISVDIIATLLGKTCCHETRWEECSCQFATRLLPSVLSLVDLIKLKKNEKRTGEQDGHHKSN